MRLLRTSFLLAAACVAAALTGAGAARAQDAPAGGEPAKPEEPAADEPIDPATTPPMPLPGVEWTRGPSKGQLGSPLIAEVAVPDGWWFTDHEGTKLLMRAMQNPVNGTEKGLIAPPIGGGEWFVVFEYDDCGYVADEDRDALDADEMLEAMKEGAKRSNEERKKMGWTVLELDGWEVPPQYDPQTNHLQWALRYHDEKGTPVVNMNVRLLGRAGVMSATWVGAPGDLAGALPRFRSILSGHEFASGHRYAEYREGDKVAEYGLAGLIAGGAVAVAAKTGILQKLWKFIVIGLVALGGFVKKLFGGGDKKPRSRTRRTVAAGEVPNQGE